MTFTTQGITSFDVQYWNGSNWVTVPGGSVTGNNKVWRKITFPAITTNMIRVVVNGSLNSYSRIVELEAWGTSGGSSLDLEWLVADQLRTPRMVFDQTGDLNNMKRHDYLPFGEELTTASGRTAAQGYAADGIRQQFSDKERDTETGLDYFLARSYSPTQGRFISPDSFFGRMANPQTINLYTYVKNNPLKQIDPDGHRGQDPQDKCQDCPVVVITVYAKPWYKRIWHAIFGGGASGAPAQPASDLPPPVPTAHPTPTPAPPPTHVYRIDGDKLYMDMYEYMSRPETPFMLALPATIPIGDPFADPESFGNVFLEESEAGVSVSQEVAPVAATINDILMPSGKLIGQAGSKATIREVQGGLADAQALFSKLSQGGTTATGSKYPGQLVNLPNGGTVGLRTVMTNSPNTAATIDVNVRGIPITKIKFN